MTVPASANRADWFEDAPLRPAERVRELGPTVVVAPHPDDEVLGCAGVIALLRRAGIPVRVIVVSDGAASHPGSTAYPPPALAALRRAESLAGLGILGVPPQGVLFLGLPDGAVPLPGAPGGAEAVSLLRRALLTWSDVATVVLPWRRDPHDDHRATSALVTSALDEMTTLPDKGQAPVRRLEYPIWARVHPGPNDVPRSNDGAVWRLNTVTVQEQKRAAILAHRSQTTGLIDDAEIAECLTAKVLERFFEPWEPFVVASASAPCLNSVKP